MVVVAVVLMLNAWISRKPTMGNHDRTLVQRAWNGC